MIILSNLILSTIWSKFVDYPLYIASDWSPTLVRLKVLAMRTETGLGYANVIRVSQLEAELVEDEY